MAVPKRQHTKARRGKRRNAPGKKQSLPNLIKCTNCNQLRESHKACPNCGFYKKA